MGRAAPALQRRRPRDVCRSRRRQSRMMARTLFDKLWDAHVIRELGDGWALLHIDRHLLHDLSGPPALADVTARGLPLHDPQLVFATPDHAVSSQPGRTGMTYPLGGRLWTALREHSGSANVAFFDLGQP